MNLLHLVKETEYGSIINRRMSPLQSWLCTHAMSSLEKYQQLEEVGFFKAETPLRRINAYIDLGNKFSVTDKLSQINTLQQIQNFKRLGIYDLHIQALWFDIYTGDIHYFSRQSKQFVEINEKNVIRLVEEVSKYYY